MTAALVPMSSGPLDRLAEVLIRAPATARAGELLRVVVRVWTLAAGPRMITTPGTSALLVVFVDRVVAQQDGPSRAGAIPLILRTGADVPAQAVPSSVRLVAYTGAPLPAGQYGLVAVLGYRNDSLNNAVDGGLTPLPDARGFVLVSTPVPVEVRRR